MATTITSAKAWAPDIMAYPPGEAIPDALILDTATIAGSVEGDDVAVRIPYVADDAAVLVAEGDDIPESDPGLSEAVVLTVKVAQLCKLSRELFDQDASPELLAHAVRRAVTRKADAVYLAQPQPATGQTWPPPGILNTPGILDGGEITTNLDPLVDTVALIETNGGVPSGIIAAPDAWAALRKIKVWQGVTEGHEAAETLLAVEAGGTTDRTLLNLPVTVNAAMPTGTLLVFDRAAIVAAVGDVQIAQSDQQYFASDSIGLRATFRFGAALMRPDRVAKLTIDN